MNTLNLSELFVHCVETVHIFTHSKRHKALVLQVSSWRLQRWITTDTLSFRLNSAIGTEITRYSFWKDAIQWLVSSDCAGRVSARRTVMLQEPRTPVDVEGNPPFPLQQVLLFDIVFKKYGVTTGLSIRDIKFLGLKTAV